MSTENRGQSVPLPASEKILKPENISDVHEASSKSILALSESIEDFKDKVKDHLNQIVGAKRLEVEKKIRDLNRRVIEVAKEAAEFEGEDERLTSVKTKIEDLEIEINDALEVLKTEIYTIAENRDKVAALEKEKFDLALDGFNDLINYLDQLSGSPKATGEIQQESTELKTLIAEFKNAKKSSSTAFDFKDTLDKIFDKSQKIDDLVKAIGDKKFKTDVVRGVKEKIKSFNDAEKNFSSSEAFDATAAISDLLKRAQSFRNKAKKSGLVDFQAEADKIIQEIPEITKLKTSEDQLKTLLDNEKRLADLEELCESKNLIEIRASQATKAEANVVERKEAQTKKDREELEAVANKKAEKRRKKAEETVVREEEKKAKAKQRLELDREQREQREVEAVETAKNRSKEIPASLMADFVESAKTDAASAISETVNFILSKELASVVNAEIDDKAHVEAIENMFDNASPDPELLKKLKKYGVKDWETFVKVWKGGLAREKVVPAMETWLKGELVRRATTATGARSGWEKFKNVLSNIGVVNPVAQKILFSLVVVGAGGLIGGAALSGVGVVGAAGAAAGASVAAVFRTWLNRNCNFLKNLDKQTQERMGKLSAEKDLRLINNLMESSAQSFTTEYFGVKPAENPEPTEDKNKTTGFFGRLKTIKNKIFGTEPKRDLKTINTEGEVNAEGALAFGAIIAKSLEDKPKAKATGEYELNDRKIILSGETNEIYLRAVADLAAKGVDINKEVAIKNELLLKLFELQSTDAKALSEVGNENKGFLVVEKLFKTMSGRGSDNRAAAYLGASVMGAGVGYAFFQNNSAARMVLGAAGGATLLNKFSESGIRTDLENQARSKVLTDLNDLRLRISNFENIIDVADQEESKKMFLQLRDLKDGKAGDLGEILALQNNPILRATAESLIKEAEEKGVIEPKEVEKMKLDFSDLDNVKKSIYALEQETDNRAAQVNGKITRKLSAGKIIKKTIFTTLGAAAGAGVAYLVGSGVQAVKHEYGTYVADSKVDALLANKSFTEKIRFFQHFGGDKNIQSVDDLPQDKLDELNGWLRSPDASKWLHNQELEIRKEDVAEVEHVLGNGKTSADDYKMLLTHFAGGKNVNSAADLSDDKIKEILAHQNDKNWLEQESREAIIEHQQNEIPEMPKVAVVFENKNITDLISDKGDISEIVSRNIFNHNPKMSGNELGTIFKAKVEELYTTAQDVSGGKKADMAEVIKMVQADLRSHNGDIDAVLRDLRATVGKGEGISHALARQFKAELLEAHAKGEDLTKLGFKGDITNERAITAWANHEAGALAKKSGFYGDDFDVRVKNANNTQAFLNTNSKGGHEVELKNSEGNLYKANPVEVTDKQVEGARLSGSTVKYLEKSFDENPVPYVRNTEAWGEPAQQDYFVDTNGNHWDIKGGVLDRNGEVITVLEKDGHKLFYKSSGGPWENGNINVYDLHGTGKVDRGLLAGHGIFYDETGKDVGTITMDGKIGPTKESLTSSIFQKHSQQEVVNTRVASTGGGSERVVSGLPQGISIDAKGGYLLETGGNKIKIGTGVPEKDFVYLKDNLSRLSSEARISDKGIAGGINNLKLGMAQKIIEAGGPNTAQKLASLINGDRVEIPSGGKALSVKLDIHGHKIEIPAKFGTEGLGLLEKNLKIFDKRFEELESLKTANPKLYEKINPLLSSHFEILRAATAKGSASLANNFDSGTTALKSQELMTMSLDTLKDLQPNSNGDFEIPFGKGKIVL